MKNCSDYSPAQDCDSEANTTDVIIIYDVREKLFLKNSLPPHQTSNSPTIQQFHKWELWKFCVRPKIKKKLCTNFFRDDELLIAQMAEIKL